MIGSGATCQAQVHAQYDRLMLAKSEHFPSLLSLIVLLVIPMHAAAQQPYRPGITFPIVGVSATQTARLNAVNLGGSSKTESSSCSVTFEFWDTRGQVQAHKLVRLRPSDSAFLDFAPQLRSGNTRMEFRAVLFFGYHGGASPTPDILQQYDCNILPSLEVFERKTGKTYFVLTETRSLPPPRNPAP